MSTPTDHKTELLRTASLAVSSIEFLSGREEFQFFLSHFRAQADKLADEILHGEMTADEREKKRQFRLGILEVLRGPQDIYSGNQAIITTMNRAG